MGMQKAGWLEDSIAKADGIYSPDGEKLKSGSMTPEQIAEWNGKSAPQQLNESPVSKSLDDMSKKELEALGRQHGIELDRRKSKGDLVEELTEHMADSP
tara:strand:- start:306 stop:602 length:297 start_codon:yes stop_codon:yes gene_type:complete